MRLVTGLMILMMPRKYHRSALDGEIESFKVRSFDGSTQELVIYVATNGFDAISLTVNTADDENDIPVERRSDRL